MIDPLFTLEDERQRRREAEQLADNSRHAALGAGLTGASVGAIGKLLGGGRRVADLMRGAGAAGAATAGLAGGATYLGGKLFGVPDEYDPTGYTETAGLGGAVGGGLLGALAGGAIGGGALKGLAKIPALRKVLQRAMHAPAVDNLLGAQFAKLAKTGGGRNALKGALLGGGLLGTGASYVAGGEGMQLDFLRNQLHDEEEIKEALSNGAY